MHITFVPKKGEMRSESVKRADTSEECIAIVFVVLSGARLVRICGVLM